MTTESNPPRAPWRRPRSLLLIHFSWGRGRICWRPDTTDQDRTLESSANGSPCASATGAETTSPPVTLTPAASAGSRRTAAAHPESAIAAAEGRVTLVSAYVLVCGTA